MFFTGDVCQIELMSNISTYIYSNYLERLPKLIAHDVIDQRIYTCRHIVQNSRDICRTDKNFSYKRIVHVVHRPHVD